MNTLTLLLSILIAIVGSILFQLNKLNRALINHFEQIEKDDLLKRYYPHIFFEFRKELRSYYNDHNTIYVDHVEYIKLMYGWKDKIQKPEKIDTWISGLCAKVNETMEKTTELKQITDYERRFVLYLFYKDFYERTKWPDHKADEFLNDPKNVFFDIEPLKSLLSYFTEDRIEG